MHWFIVMIVASLVVVAVEAASVFRLGSDAQDMRLAMEEAAAWDARTEVQFSVGPAMIGVARIVTTFIDDVPPEARQVLSGVREASVGVYRLSHQPSQAERAAMMNASAERMTGRGWHRLVAVNDGGSTVMVYTPESWDDADEINLCVAVCNGTELVIVSAASDVAPLRELVAMHAGDFRDQIGLASRPSQRDRF